MSLTTTCYFAIVLGRCNLTGLIAGCFCVRMFVFSVRKWMSIYAISTPKEICLICVNEQYWIVFVTFGCNSDMYGKIHALIYKIKYDKFEM